MTHDRLVVRPLWWAVADGQLDNFESRVTVESGDMDLLRHWAAPASIDDVASRSGRDRDTVSEAAHRLRDQGVLTPERDVAYATPAIEIEITAACQADCEFCPREAIRKSRGFAHMSADVFYQVLDNLSGRGVPGYCLCGIGEPLLHPRWLEFARAIHERDPEAVLQIYSNGWDLGGRTGQLLAESPINVLMVSVHSFDPAIRQRIMRLPGDHDVLAEVDRLLAVLKAAGSGLQVHIGQVEFPDMPRDERLARWCADRGLIFECWPNWNRAGNVTMGGAPTNWLNQSPESCYHYASAVFIDHRGMVLSCCCDAQSQTATTSARVTRLDEIVNERLVRLASGQPLTKLCVGCDASLSNKPFLETKFYSLALAK